MEESISTVKLGIVGLGRLGKRHALNLSRKVHNAHLVAACSLFPAELDWVRSELGVEQVYESYDRMLSEADIDAVFLVSFSSMHAEQSIKALRKGLHVFTEKPMGLNPGECHDVQKVVEEHPEQVFFTGFVRRFDPSYAHAKKLIDRGVVGEPFLLRSQTVDHDKYAEFQLDFVKSSGGIFMDMNVHDIDLARWFLDSEVQTVYARGGSYVHPGFEGLDDADNAVVLLTMKNGKMAIITASRTAFHGHDTHSEITCSKGILKIGMTPSVNRVEISDSSGVRVECVEDFFQRFEDAFLIEACEFVDHVQKGKKSPVSALDGARATEIAFAMSQSFRESREIRLES